MAMGLFQILKEAFTAVPTFDDLNDEFYDGLEEALILADVGADTAADTVAQLRKRVKERFIGRMDEVKDALRDILKSKLEVGDSALVLEGKPAVVLVIGVNGVGKTTTTINLAASLATLEKTVLVLDADPQANASSGLGVDIKEVDCSVYECIIDHADIRDAIYTTDIEGLDIVPSHIDLVGAEIEMLNMKDREKVLKGLLQPIRDEYDYILIDCSPSLGLITVNALTAADSVIIPVQCEYFALEGISKLLNTIKIIKSKLNPKLEIEGFLLTMYDSRLRLARQIYDEVKRHFQELVFRTVIQRNVKLSESPSHGLPVILYDADSAGARNHLSLAKEIIEHNKKG